MLRLDRRSSRNPLGHRREDFHALDGIDAEIRLQVHVQPEGLGRIAGFLGHDPEQNRGGVVNNRRGDGERSGDRPRSRDGRGGLDRNGRQSGHHRQRPSG